jgi:hypothetical protein
MVCVHICVPSFQRFKQLTHFHEMWCEYCATGGHANMIHFHFLQSEH